MSKKARLIAFYLPQYHPIPENDAWWGKGFTEWTNVAKARPLFRGHYQPHIPADLGFYDLRVLETRIAQAEMAQGYGIEGFCYWHYWFAGRQLLERPFNEVLRSGEPDFPFCLGWANEPWTGAWVGDPKRLLVDQTYPGIEEHREHFHYLLQAFIDNRYITVDNKPLLFVYRPHLIPDIRRVTDFWRQLALDAGLKGLHLVGADLSQTEIEVFGFDASSYHYPGWGKRLGIINKRKNLPKLLQRLAVWHYPWFLKQLLGSFVKKRYIHKVQILPYYNTVKEFVYNYPPFFNHYPLLLPNWDNTPRLGQRGYVLHNSTPALFRSHIIDVLAQVESKPLECNIIFIKSWNEWAEGNYLEPDMKFGKGYLEALQKEVFTYDTNDC